MAIAGPLRILETVAVFGATLALVSLRPRRWSEAWWTVGGALAMLSLGLVSPQEAFGATLDGRAALLFLLALLLLSFFIGKSGFFDWAAIRCAGWARGDGRALYRNAFVLGALITVTLSLDTTAVILTPIVLALVKRLRIAALPYVVMCAFVSNVASLLLPISNLTNILFAVTFHLTFASFAARMLVPQLVALAVTYALLRRAFRAELPPTFDAASLPPAASVVPDRRYFLACIAVLVCVLGGYFVAPLFGLEPYTIAFAGVAILAVAGAITRRATPAALSEVSWGVFPFVIGLFVAVRAVENLGFAARAAEWLGTSHSASMGAMLRTAAFTAASSNVLNNLPAALLVRGILESAHVHPGAAFAALLGANAGSILTPFGSLATMLVLSLARRDGVLRSSRTIFRLALFLAPVLVVVTTLALGATFVLVP